MAFSIFIFVNKSIKYSTVVNVIINLIFLTSLKSYDPHISCYQNSRERVYIKTVKTVNLFRLTIQFHELQFILSLEFEVN